MFICIHCSMGRANANSLRNHERLCKLNPKRQTTKFQDLEFQKNKASGNQFTSGKCKSHSDETKKKLSISSTGRKHSDETKQKLSECAKENGLGGVTQSRWIVYNGKRLGSSYELQLAKDLDANGIKWDVCSRFKYIDPSGKERTYTPDIYLIDYDVYLDPKNDFLINNVNPALGFSDAEKIRLVCEQNGITVYILWKNQLNWETVKMLL